MKQACGRPRSSANSAAVKPPSGPVRIGGTGVRRQGREGGGGGLRVAPFGADDRQALPRPAGDQRRQFHGRLDRGQVQTFGLFRRFGRDAGGAGNVHLADLGTLGQDRLQGGDAKLGRLLDHIVEMRLFDRGGAKPQIARGLRRP